MLLGGATLAQSQTLVISQVYGGGGNDTATLKNDFIEIYNPGATAVDLSGWSVQYASAAGVVFQMTNLTGTIQPGHYYLVQQAAGQGGTTALPTPEASGSIPMSATSGVVALVHAQIPLVGCGISCANRSPGPESS